jgi:hypothetical protein
LAEKKITRPALERTKMGNVPNCLRAKPSDVADYKNQQLISRWANWELPVFFPFDAGKTGQAIGRERADLLTGKAIGTRFFLTAAVSVTFANPCPSIRR